MLKKLVLIPNFSNMGHKGLRTILGSQYLLPQLQEIKIHLNSRYLYDTV